MKRRFHAYGVGVGRTGTRSMAGIFSPYYRSLHEPYRMKFGLIILEYYKGHISKEDFRKYTVLLDNKLQLEFNGSFLNSWLLEVLVGQFPDAKFIFTIRDCYSWVNSYIYNFFVSNRQIVFYREKFRTMILGKGISRYTQQERKVYQQGPYTLDFILSYWARTNEAILKAIPPSRLLVIKTHEISSKKNEIADFLNIPSSTLDFTKSHLNKDMRDVDILSGIDHDYLSSIVNKHCKSLMDRFFPGFTYNVSSDA